MEEEDGLSVRLKDAADKSTIRFPLLGKSRRRISLAQSFTGKREETQNVPRKQSRKCQGGELVS